MRKLYAYYATIEAKGTDGHRVVGSAFMRTRTTKLGAGFTEEIERLILKDNPDLVSPVAILNLIRLPADDKWEW
jgi:hypothetical protein